VGETVLRNVLAGSFKGPVYPVNPHHDLLAGRRVYHSVQELPQAPDLALICTPPASVPGLIAELGKLGTRAVIVFSGDMGARNVATGHVQRQAMLDAARPHLVRILGPNCVGLLVPGIGLNASFAHTDATRGKLAFVSQSGALMTGVLDWAKSHGIGFSRFISIGDSADVDVGDVLDYLAGDGETRAILLYVEDIPHARKFMSAARAAARSKPVVVIKAGRVPEGARAAAFHSGAVAGSDLVYDAVLRRAGMLRVYSTEDLFEAVETLARARPIMGERLAIITNGGGPGVMATDALVSDDGHLSELSATVRGQLDAVLPPTWSHNNPIDIIGDAPPERYLKTFQVMLSDPDADALLFIHAPTAIVPSKEIAQTLLPLIRQSSMNVLTCWFGSGGVAEARQLFSEAGLPTYDTPEGAVRGFMQIVQYRRNQDLLMQVPPTLPVGRNPDHQRVRAIIDGALAEGRVVISEPEAKIILSAYGIPVVDTRIAVDIEAAVAAAEALGYPVAIKILSPDITQKSDVGGVALDIDNADGVRSVAARMVRRLQRHRPDAQLCGFSVQTMVNRPDAVELVMGVETDPVFGPVVVFGQGGIAVEVTADRSVALPPLNMVLAQDLVSRTRVSKLLAGYSNRPPADLDAVCRTLVQVAQMAIDLPEMLELDINPVLVDRDGVIALDARMRLDPQGAGRDRLAIRPYPQELEEWIDWEGQRLLLRPIKPEDGTAHVEFFNALDPEDVRNRMFIRMRELQPSQLARLTQIDYDREMAFVAGYVDADGRWKTLAVGRVIADPDNISAEFAAIVRSELKGRGLGHILMLKLINYCRARGTQRITGEVLSPNWRMLKLVRELGFHVYHSDDPGTMMMDLDLTQPPPPAAPA
jgi:acetyltransferase